MLSQTAYRIKSSILREMLYTSGCTDKDVAEQKILALRTHIGVIDPDEAEYLGERCDDLVNIPHSCENYAVYYFKISGFGNTKILLGKIVVNCGFTDYYVSSAHRTELVYFKTISHNRKLDSLHILSVN